jgi:hypothetical protein
MLVPTLLRDTPINDSLRENTLQREEHASAPIERGSNTMDELLSRVRDMLIGREHGPLAFRLVIQPMVAVFLAIRAALKDARLGRPAHGWAIVTDPVRRRELLRESWHNVARLFVAAVIVDMIYEIIVFRRIHPGQALIVAAIVALPSYLLLRGPVARHWLGSGGGTQGEPTVARAVGSEPRATAMAKQQMSKSDLRSFLDPVADLAGPRGHVR